MSSTILSSAEFIAKAAAAHATEVARFTLDGSDELERQLAQACQNVLAGVQSIVPLRKLEALWLGGGYGRGEGGVLRTESGGQPYNDLEFYVFIRGNHWINERRFGKILQRFAHELTATIGVEVELKIISFAKIRRSPASMFYYDLVSGHHCLSGDDKFPVNCEHHCDARNLPLSEAARLLMNRCTGLLLAREKLERNLFSMAEADFVQRNIAKAQLAFGDAMLTAFGCYHWSCLKRHERLQRLSVVNFPWIDEIRQHHADGVKFKLHPHLTSMCRSELRALHENITAFALKVWLWLERGRLNVDFMSARDYALSPVNKWPATNPWRNLLLNAKTFGPTALFSKHCCRHPRERILVLLALMLWKPAAHDLAMQRWLDKKLLKSASPAASQMDIYQGIWRQLS